MIGESMGLTVQVYYYIWFFTTVWIAGCMRKLQKSSYMAHIIIHKVCIYTYVFHSDILRLARTSCVTTYIQHIYIIFTCFYIFIFISIYLGDIFNFHNTNTHNEYITGSKYIEINECSNGWAWKIGFWTSGSWF